MSHDSRLGAAALLCWGVHAAGPIVHGEIAELLWFSTLATLILAAGCFARSRAIVGVAFLWLIFGTALWLADLAAGAPLDSAIFTHAGSLGIAVAATRRRAVPAGSWPWATAGLAGSLVLARLCTPPARNINLAWRVSPGWESWFPSHAVYLTLLFGLGAAFFRAVERGVVRS